MNKFENKYIWYDKNLSLEELQDRSKHSMSEYLEIEFVSILNNTLVAKMPVIDKTKQPMGNLHGGASAALAETIGSVATIMVIDNSIKTMVGLELNCNHIKGISEGYVYAYCSPFHIGRSTHVWNIEIKNEQENLICISRFTSMILDKKNI